MFLAETSTELWIKLLKEGQSTSKIGLTESQESYAVFMLQRFLRRTEFASVPFALQYLEGMLIVGPIERQGRLADVADASLIMAGLFPERARRINVNSDYFIQMSRMCFQELIRICQRLKRQGETMLYQEIQEGVPDIAHVLYALRSNASNKFFSAQRPATTLH